MHDCGTVINILLGIRQTCTYWLSSTCCTWRVLTKGPLHQNRFSKFSDFHFNLTLYHLISISPGVKIMFSPPLRVTNKTIYVISKRIHIPICLLKRYFKNISSLKLWKWWRLCASVTSAGECRFPEDWVGRWYQSGLGEIIIQKNDIQKKGECAEKKKQHYIIFNRQVKAEF